MSGYTNALSVGYIQERADACCNMVANTDEIHKLRIWRVYKPHRRYIETGSKWLRLCATIFSSRLSCLVRLWSIKRQFTNQSLSYKIVENADGKILLQLDHRGTFRANETVDN